MLQAPIPAGQRQEECRSWLEGYTTVQGKHVTNWTGTRRHLNPDAIAITLEAYQTKHPAPTRLSLAALWAVLRGCGLNYEYSFTLQEQVCLDVIDVTLGWEVMSS